MYDYYDFDIYDEPFLTGGHISESDAFSSVMAVITSMVAGLSFLLIVAFVIAIIILIAKWKLFKKAGRKPWESLIPIHSDIVELELGGIETYWYFLNYSVVIPVIGWILGWIPITIINFWRCISLSKAFGKSTGFGVLMAFFPFIGYPMLAFGNSQYIGPQTNTNTQNYSSNNINTQPGYNYQDYSNSGFASTNTNYNATSNYSQENNTFNNVDSVTPVVEQSQPTPTPVATQIQQSTEPVASTSAVEQAQPISAAEPVQPAISQTAFNKSTDPVQSIPSTSENVQSFNNIQDGTASVQGGEIQSDSLSSNGVDSQQTNLFDDPNM